VRLNSPWQLWELVEFTILIRQLLQNLIRSAKLLFMEPLEQEI
jgi:hypothetical protein